MRKTAQIRSARGRNAVGIALCVLFSCPALDAESTSTPVAQVVRDVVDLSAFGYIEAHLTNTSEQILNISLRVDSIASGTTPAGTGTAASYLRPGESGVARVYFARPKKGSAPISPNLLSHLFFFIGKNETAPRSFRLESLTAGGRPGDVPPPRS